MKRSPLLIFAGAVTLAVALTGGLTSCGQQFRAERDGRDLGSAVCDLADATTAQEARAALADIKAQTTDLADQYGSVTAEDRKRITENLSDLQKHVADGDEALAHQDLAAIERNAQQIRTQFGQANDSAWDGFTDELESCTS